MKRHWVQFVAAASAMITLSLLLASCATNPEKAKLNYLHKGEAYMKQKQYASAAIEFRNALKVDPRYVEAYYQLAQADLGIGDIDDARAAYKALGQAISLDPNRLDARVLRAQLLFAAGPDNYADATRDLDYVLKQDPNNVTAHRVLGSIFGRQGHYDQALQEFSKDAALAPNDPQSYIDLAVANSALQSTDPNGQHLEEAQQDIQKAISLNPKPAVSYSAYSELARIYAMEKKPEQVQQALQDGIKANPSDPSSIKLYIELALIFENQRKPSDAQNTLDSLAKEMPNSAVAAELIGDFYSAAHMNDRALAAYQAGLSNNPRNLLLEQGIEDVYLRTSQTDSAAKLNNEMLKQEPTNVAAQVDRGRILMEQSKYADAVTALQKAATDNPNVSLAHYYLAMADLKNSDPVSANNELQQTLRVTPQPPQTPTPQESQILQFALRELVDLNFEQGKDSVAQLYAKELVQKVPSDPTSHLLLGKVLLKIGQLKQAEDEFVAAQQLAPADPRVHESFAALYVAHKDFPRAEQEFQTAIHAAPSNVLTVRSYITFLFQQKQQEKATAVATQFVTQNPNDPDGHMLLGEVDLAVKNYSAALSETQKAQQLSPKTGSPYFQMGQIYDAQGNNDAAIQAYEQGMAATSPTAPIATTIGSLYEKEGNLPKASAEFQQALNIDPNFIIAANNLAWIYAEQNQNLDAALRLAEKAKNERPDFPNFADTLAWVMFRRGDYAAAVPLLKDCVAKDPSSAQYLYHLGMVLVADGQKNEGKAKLQAALQKNLDSQDAEQARKTLSQ